MHVIYKLGKVNKLDFNIPFYGTFIAVVVTGGSDSLALTLLARQAFRKVIGITVDHRLAQILYTEKKIEPFRFHALTDNLIWKLWMSCDHALSCIL